MTDTISCEHGSLKRSCHICELEAEIRHLTAQLDMRIAQVAGYEKLLDAKDSACVCRGAFEPCETHRMCDSNTALMSLYRSFLADANSAISVLRIESKRLRDAVNPP